MHLLRSALIGVVFVMTATLCVSHAHGSELRPGFSIGKESTIESIVLAEKRTYWVSLPASYEVSHQNRYPVLYVLDAEANFHIAAAIADFMSFGTYGNNTQIPELIVVAVSNSNRIRDMTPTRSTVGMDGRPSERYAASGGGDKFLDFIEQELIPTIDKTYRTLPHRTLAGHSLAGLLTVHALMTRPALFNAHVIIDPSLWWDNEVMLLNARGWRRQSAEPNAVFLSLANNPNVGLNDPKKELSRGKRLGRMLKLKGGPQSRTKYEYFPNEDHAAVPLMSFYRGLLHVFDGFAPPSSEVIKRPAALREHYESVQSRFGMKLLPTEAFLDQTGSHLLYTLAEVEKAREVFAFYESVYPASYVPAASLGDVFFAKGEYARAGEYYRKALVLNPKDTYVPTRIRALEDRMNARSP